MSSAPSSTSRPSDPPAEPFPVRRVASVPARPAGHKWLIEDLWLAAGVGLLAGAPKLGKTYLAAEIAVAVAAGDQVLRGLALDSLAIDLLDLPTLRLERQDEVRRLRATVAQCQPRLLVLDPFIRLARIDENSSAEVSTILSTFRAIQRDYDVAVLLMHHTRKSPAAHPTLAVRGSSDFAAWSDSNLLLTQRRHTLTLTIEHRSAPAPDPISCRLVAEPVPHFRCDRPTPDVVPPPDQLQSDILRYLAAARRPITTSDLRAHLRRRKADVTAALDGLRRQGTLQRDLLGWVLSDHR